jgi:hypothetical protein
MLGLFAVVIGFLVLTENRFFAYSLLGSAAFTAIFGFARRLMKSGKSGRRRIGEA